MLAARIRLPLFPWQCTLRLERLRDKAQRVAVWQAIIQFESELQAVEEVGVVREAATPLLAVLCSSFFCQASEEPGEESCCFLSNKQGKRAATLTHIRQWTPASPVEPSTRLSWRQTPGALADLQRRVDGEFALPAAGAARAQGLACGRKNR